MIEIENVRKSFGSLEVLKGIDLTVDKGGVLTVIGAKPGAASSATARLFAVFRCGRNCRPGCRAIAARSIACPRRPVAHSSMTCAGAREHMTASSTATACAHSAGRQ